MQAASLLAHVTRRTVQLPWQQGEVEPPLLARVRERLVELTRPLIPVRGRASSFSTKGRGQVARLCSAVTRPPGWACSPGPRRIFGSLEVAVKVPAGDEGRATAAVEMQRRGRGPSRHGSLVCNSNSCDRSLSDARGAHSFEPLCQICTFQMSLFSLYFKPIHWRWDRCPCRCAPAGSAPSAAPPTAPERGSPAPSAEPAAADGPAVCSPVAPPAPRAPWGCSKERSEATTCSSTPSSCSSSSSSGPLRYAPTLALSRSSSGSVWQSCQQKWNETASRRLEATSAQTTSHLSTHRCRRTRPEGQRRSHRAALLRGSRPVSQKGEEGPRPSAGVAACRLECMVPDSTFARGSSGIRVGESCNEHQDALVQPPSSTAANGDRGPRLANVGACRSLWGRLAFPSSTECRRKVLKSTTAQKSRHRRRARHS